MAISYTNVIKTNVLDSLEKILEDEFNLPVGYKNIGNESISIMPQSDDLVELISNGQVRSYSILISYEMNKGGEFENNMDHLSKRAERCKRIIHNNTAYAPSSSYKFHDGRIESIEYEQDPDSPEILRANMTFNCIVTESI